MAAAVTVVLIRSFDFAVIHSLLSQDPPQCHDMRKTKIFEMRLKVCGAEQQEKGYSVDVSSQCLVYSRLCG